MLPVTALALAGGPSRYARPAPLAVASGLLAGLASILFLRRDPQGTGVGCDATDRHVHHDPGAAQLHFPQGTLTLAHVRGLVCGGLAVFLLTR